MSFTRRTFLAAAAATALGACASASSRTRAVIRRAVPSTTGPPVSTTTSALTSGPITVFAVGQWLAANPTMAEKILAAGHELANHTYTHPALASQPRATIESEITRCRDVLRAQTGSGGRWFRPSGVEGTPNATILAEAGLAGYPVVVGFDVDPLDYEDPGANAIVSRTATKLQAGSIVSLHLGHAGTVAAFERLVTSARGRGLEPVVVSDLLQA